MRRGTRDARRGAGVSEPAALAAYAPGLAAALVATAAGLRAALPAVIVYNFLLGRLRAVDARVEEFIADYTHRVQGGRG